MLLHVSILRSSSGSVHCFLLKLYVKTLINLLYLSVMWQHIVLYPLQGSRSTARAKSYVRAAAAAGVTVVSGSRRGGGKPYELFVWFKVNHMPSHFPSMGSSRPILLLSILPPNGYRMIFPTDKAHGLLAFI